MPSKKPSMIDALRAKHDPHYQLASKVEGLGKDLPIQVAQLHKTLSKSFAMQRKTLTRVLGLEKRVADNETRISNLADVAIKIGQQQAEKEEAVDAPEAVDEIPEGLDDLIDEVRGEKEVGGTKTKKKPRVIKREYFAGGKKKKPKAGRKKPRTIKREYFAGGIDPGNRRARIQQNKKDVAAGEERRKTDAFKEDVFGVTPDGEPLSPEERKIRFRERTKTITGESFRKGTAEEVGDKIKADTTGARGMVPFKKGPDLQDKDKDLSSREEKGDSEIESSNKIDQVLKFLKTDLVSKLNEILDGLNGIGDSLKEQNDISEEGREKQRLLTGTAKKRGREKELEKDDSKGPNIGEKLLKSAAKPVKGFLSTIWKFVSNIIAGTVFNFLLKFVKAPGKLLEPIKKFFNGLVGLFNMVVKGLWNMTAKPINMIVDGLNSGIKVLLGAINKAIGLLGLKPIEPPTIPTIPGPPNAPDIPLAGAVKEDSVEPKAGGGEVGASAGASGKDGKDGVVGMFEGGTVPAEMPGYENSLVQPMKDGAEVIDATSGEQPTESADNPDPTQFGLPADFDYDNPKHRELLVDVLSPHMKKFVQDQNKMVDENPEAFGGIKLDMDRDGRMPNFGKFISSMSEDAFNNSVAMLESNKAMQNIPEAQEVVLGMMTDIRRQTLDKPNFKSNMAFDINKDIPGTAAYRLLMKAQQDTTSSAAKSGAFTPEQLARQANRQNMSGGGLVVQPMAGGGTVDAKNISAKEGGPIKNDSGVSVTGLGPDTQLVAAQPGEVMMSKKAVDHFGRDRLLQMNKEGGGTNQNRVTTTNNIQPKEGGGEVKGKSLRKGGSKLGGGLIDILKGGDMGMFAPQMMLLKPMLGMAESIAEKIIPQMGKAVDGTKNLILKHPAIGFAKLIFGEEKVNSWLGLTSSEGKESSPSTQSDSISPSLKSSDISPPSTAPKTNVITIPSPPQSSGGGGGSTPTSPNFSSVDSNNLSAIAVRPIYNLAGA